MTSQQTTRPLTINVASSSLTAVLYRWDAAESGEFRVAAERQLVPDLRVRVVNVIDLRRLFPAECPRHGRTEAEFVKRFTADQPVVFTFHGYQRAINERVHPHPDVNRIHLRGFNEQGMTTTPAQMVARCAHTLLVSRFANDTWRDRSIRTMLTKHRVPWAAALPIPGKRHDEAVLRVLST